MSRLVTSGAEGSSSPQGTLDDKNQPEVTKDAKQPVCGCNFAKPECDVCGKGWRQEILAGRACQLGHSATSKTIHFSLGPRVIVD